MATRVEGFGTVVSATIANGGTDSSAIQFKSYAQGIFVLPAAFTGTAVSFKVSETGQANTWTAFYNDANTLVSITVTQGRAYAFPIDLFPAPFVQIVSNGAEGADRNITVYLKY